MKRKQQGRRKEGERREKKKGRNERKEACPRRFSARTRSLEK